MSEDNKIETPMMPTRASGAPVSQAEVENTINNFCLSQLKEQFAQAIKTVDIRMPPVAPATSVSMPTRQQQMRG
jgi:hypothetical protein